MFVSKRLSVIFGEFKTVVIGYFTIVDYKQVKEHFLKEIIVFKRTLADQLENDELLVTLDVLEAEMRLSNPRIPVIRGMLANLETYSELKEFKLRLMGYYNIKNS